MNANHINAGDSTAKGASLLVVGASGRFVAQSAARAGFQVDVIDLFADQDTRLATVNSRPKITASKPAPDEGFAESCRQMSDLPIAVTARLKERPACLLFTGGMENHAAFLAQMPQQSRRYLLPVEAYQRCRDIRRVRKVCVENTILFPKTRFDAPVAAESEGGNRWLVKQPNSAGGYGVSYWDPALWDSALGRPESLHCYYQQFRNGCPVGATFVAVRGGDGVTADLLGVCESLNGMPNDSQRGCDGDRENFRYHGSFGPLDLGSPLVGKIQRAGQIIAAEFELCGVFGIDFIIDAGDVWLLEVNPRFPASAELIERYRLQRGRKFSIAQTHLDAFSGIRPQPHDHDQTTAKRLFASRIVVRPIENARPRRWITTPHISAAIENLNRSADNSPAITDLPPTGTEIMPNQPVVTVHCSATDRGELMKNLDSMELKVLAIFTS